MSEENTSVEGEVNEPAEVLDESTQDQIDQTDETNDTEESATSTDDTSEKPKKGFQKRIDELTRMRYEEAEKRKEAEEQARQYQAELDKLRQQYTQTTHETTKPRLEDYLSHDEWAAATEHWMREGLNQQLTAQQEALKQQQAYQQQLEKQRQIQTNITKAQQKYPDFMVKVNNPELPSLAQINQSAYDALVESESFGEVAYYLASNPSEIYEFSHLTPIQAVKKIATIESRLSSKPSQTKAPAPPSKVDGKSTATQAEPEDIESWMRWRDAQLRNNK